MGPSQGTANPHGSAREYRASIQRRDTVWIDPAIGHKLEGTIAENSRLRDEKTQEWYYDQITARVLDLYSKHSPDKVTESLSNLTLSGSETSRGTSSRTTGAEDLFPQGEVDIILLALRKLREATLASAPSATTSKYSAFSIRTSILFNDPKSYAPALEHLLRTHVLPEALQREFLGYHLLDLVCRQGKFADAFSILVRCRDDVSKRDLVERQLRDTILAVVRDNPIQYFRMIPKLDGRQRRIAMFAEKRLVQTVLKAVAKSYMQIDTVCLLNLTGRSRWEELQQQFHVGWDRTADGVVHVRKPNPKSKT